MISSTGTRLAAFSLAVAAGLGLVGCGNGVEVRGPSNPSNPSKPSDSSSAPVSSPSPAPTAADSPSDSPAHSPGARTQDRTTESPSPSDPAPSEAGDDSQRDGGRSGGNNKDGNDRSHGSQTSAPPDTGGEQRSGRGAIAKCGLGDLHISLRAPAGGGAAGSQYVLLTFTNTSRQPCTMYGYAGVSFVGHQNGTQLGKPAVRDRSRSPERVRLAPGNTKSELLGIADAGNFDPKTCQPTTSDGFRVYPPDSYTAAYVPFRTSACQGKVAQLSVYSVGTKS